MCLKKLKRSQKHQFNLCVSLPRVEFQNALNWISFWEAWDLAGSWILKKVPTPTGWPLWKVWKMLLPMSFSFYGSSLLTFPASLLFLKVEEISAGGGLEECFQKTCCPITSTRLFAQNESVTSLFISFEIGFHHHFQESFLPLFDMYWKCSDLNLWLRDQSRI